DGLLYFTCPASSAPRRVPHPSPTRRSSDLAGRSINFANATTIDGASFYVAGGAHLALPKATAYDHAATNAFQDRHFQAAGIGSRSDEHTSALQSPDAHVSRHVHINTFGGAV